jgi:hypothetical protein
MEEEGNEGGIIFIEWARGESTAIRDNNQRNEQEKKGSGDLDIVQANRNGRTLTLKYNAVNSL